MPHGSSAAGAKKLTKTVKFGLEAIGHSANGLLSGVLPGGRVNAKVVYKLLWHLLKCHRERLGAATNAALMYLIVNGGSIVSFDDIVVPNGGAIGGFWLSPQTTDDDHS